MSDYMVWAAEKLEVDYGWDFDDALEWLGKTHYIPYPLTIQKYLEETT